MKHASCLVIILCLLLSPVSALCHASHVPKDFPDTGHKAISYTSPQDDLALELQKFIPDNAQILCISAENAPHFLKKYRCITCNAKQQNKPTCQFDAICITEKIDDELSIINRVCSLEIENKPIIIGNIYNPRFYHLFLSLSAELERPFTMYSINEEEHYVVLLPIEHGKTYDQERSLVLALTYSPSHQILAEEWLLPSLQDSFEIAISKIPQECPRAIIEEPGWGKTVRRKIEHIVNTIEAHMGRIMLHCDADIQCFSPVKSIIMQCLEEHDMAFQMVLPPRRMCSGLFAVRCNKKTLAFFKDVLLFMQTYDIQSDQAPINYLLNFTPWGKKIKHCFLPTTFMSGGFLVRKPFCQRRTMFVPDNMHMHHATCSKGVRKKIRQLSRIKNTIQKK